MAVPTGSVRQSRAVYRSLVGATGSLGESTSGQEKSMIWVVYGSLGHSTGSLEQSTKVYRESTAVQVSIWGSIAV